MKRLIGVSLGAAFVSCTPSQIIVRKAPAQALENAKKRLVERDIVIDPSGQRPDRLRTATFCYPVPNAREHSWDASFGRMRPGPVSFTVKGPMSDQDKAVAECPYLFQLEVVAQPKGDDTQLVATSAWWQAASGPCKTVGDPLLGEVECTYNYSGAKAPGDAEGFIYGVLKGL